MGSSQSVIHTFTFIQFNISKSTVNMAKKYTEEQIQELKDVFSSFDKDGNGTISISELESVMNALDQFPTQQELQKMINEDDLDKNGVIDFNEFVALMSKDDQEPDIVIDEDSIRKAFRAFDQDGNGYISAAELKQVMKDLDEFSNNEDVQDIINSADRDGDGQVNYEEFLNSIKEELRK